MFSFCEAPSCWCPTSSSGVVERVEHLPAHYPQHASISGVESPLNKEHRRAADYGVHTIEQMKEKMAALQAQHTQFQEKYTQFQEKYTQLQEQHDGLIKVLRALIIDVASTKDHLSSRGLLDSRALDTTKQCYIARVRQCRSGGP